MALELLLSQHNPDVLSCLANLSSDEVFTPPAVVNQMLDMLPQELFCNPDTTFLDPGVKSGVFLREIAKRLIAGLENQIPDLEERIDHIFKKQLFGIATTQLTSLLARRSLYCSKYPNSNFSVVKFDNPEGNIRYRRIEHRWQDGKCIYCGANQDEYERDTSLESYAYEFIHNDVERIFKMRFDVIISNPPYQLSTGGGLDNSTAATQAKPIYHRFVQQAKKLNPRFITMIIPARWYAGGIGLNDFRNEMINDKHIETLVDYINSRDCFTGVNIAGGICYFLWNRDKTADECNVVNISGQVQNSLLRPLNQFGTFFMRSNIAMSIIRKVQNKASEFMNEYVSSLDTFGLPTNEHGHSVKKNGDLVLLHSVGSNSQGKSYIERSRVKKNAHLIDKFKVKISRMIPQNGEVGVDPSKGYRSIAGPYILYPGEIDTMSYLNIGFFDTETEAVNYYNYIQCKFPRYLLRSTYSGVNVSKDNFVFVPKMDFSKPWDDNKLYEYFELSDEEKELIEQTMRAMDTSGGE